MRYLIGILFIIMVWSCKQKVEIPSDRHVVEGIIVNPGFNKFFVSDLSTLQPLASMVFNANTKGYVEDSVWKKERGLYVANYGDESFYYYEEPGSRIRFRTKSSALTDDLLFEGDFAEVNNYMAKSNQLLKDTIQALSKEAYNLDESAFLARFDSMQNIINAVLSENKPKQNIELVDDFMTSSYQLEMHSFLLQYPEAHSMITQNPNFKPSENFITKMSKLPELKDSMIIYIPTYRQLLMGKLEPALQEEINKNQTAVNAKKISPVYLFMNVVEKDSTLSQLKKDYLLGTFATQFDYTPQNPMLKEVNDSLQKVIKNEDVKKDLAYTYHLITNLKPGTAAPALSGKLMDNQLENIVFNKPTMLYFYTTADTSLDYNFQQINDLKNKYNDSIQVVSVNFDKSKDWQYFRKNIEVKTIDLYEDERYHSPVAKSYDIEVAVLPRIIFVQKDGNIYNNSAPNLGTVEFMEEFNKFLNTKVEK